MDLDSSGSRWITSNEEKFRKFGHSTPDSADRHFVRMMSTCPNFHSELPRILRPGDSLKTIIPFKSERERE
jgi:hypothetical protein